MGDITKVRELRDVQGQPGNCEGDPYMRGLYNGLELALAVMEDRDPVYKPKEAASGVAPGSMVQVGWICKDDLARLSQTGEAEVYEERQEFSLLPEQEQFAVYVRKDACSVAMPGEPSDTERLAMVLHVFEQRDDNMPLTPSERDVLIAFNARGEYTKSMRQRVIDSAIRAARTDGVRVLGHQEESPEDADGSRKDK